MTETVIHYSNTRQKIHIRKKKEEINSLFGNKCQHCPSTEKLEYAHKIGFRTNHGRSRGQSTRILAIAKNPEQFLRLCKTCHLKYDRENPLTEEEKAIIEQKENERVPF